MSKFAVHREASGLTTDTYYAKLNNLGKLYSRCKPFTAAMNDNS